MSQDTQTKREKTLVNILFPEEALRVILADAAILRVKDGEAHKDFFVSKKFLFAGPEDKEGNRSIKVGILLEDEYGVSRKDKAKEKIAGSAILALAEAQGLKVLRNKFDQLFTK